MRQTLRLATFVLLTASLIAALAAAPPPAKADADMVAQAKDAQQFAANSLTAGFTKAR